MINFSLSRERVSGLVGHRTPVMNTLKNYPLPGVRAIAVFFAERHAERGEFPRMKQERNFLWQTQGEADGSIEFLNFPFRQSADFRLEAGFGNRQDRIAVDDAEFGQAVFWAKRNLHGNSADGRCHRRYGDGRPHSIGFVSAEENNGPSSGRRLKPGPPDLALSHVQSSSGRASAAAAAIASAATASSGFRRYPLT